MNKSEKQNNTLKIVLIIVICLSLFILILLTLNLNPTKEINGIENYKHLYKKK